MAADPNTMEQAVSRALRDSLEKIQRTAEELHQAIHDLVSSCASSRPSNALPSMIRAQTSAASLSATLEVLSRFVTGALQAPMRSPFEAETLRVPSMNSAQPAARLEQPAIEPAHLTNESPLGESLWTMPTIAGKLPVAAEALSTADSAIVANPEFPPAVAMPPAAEFTTALDTGFLNEPAPAFVDEPAPELEPEALDAIVEPPASVEPEAEPIFSLDSLPPEEQELHRRAYRVAKVSMQDIKMLRPDDVRAGREHGDICSRLRDDIEKAHKEYDRRFLSIQSHPVDYFYDWMVEILAGGDAQALGEYPYRSAVLHR
jgi:hypothetical protein